MSGVDWRDVARTMAADQAREDYMDWLAECEEEDRLAEEERWRYRWQRMAERPPVYYHDGPDTRLFGP